MARLPAAEPSRGPGGGGEAAVGRAGRRGPRFAAAAARARRAEGPRRRPPRCLPSRPRRRGCGVRRRRRALRPGRGSGGPGGARVPGGGSGGGSSRSSGGSGAPSPGALGSRSAPASAFSERRCRCGSPGAAGSGGGGGSAPAAAALCPAAGLLGGSAAARPQLCPARPRRGPPPTLLGPAPPRSAPAGVCLRGAPRPLPPRPRPRLKQPPAGVPAVFPPRSQKRPPWRRSLSGGIRRGRAAKLVVFCQRSAWLRRLRRDGYSRAPVTRRPLSLPYLKASCHKHPGVLLFTGETRLSRPAAGGWSQGVTTKAPQLLDYCVVLMAPPHRDSLAHPAAGPTWLEAQTRFWMA